MRLLSALVLLGASLIAPACAQRPSDLSADSCFNGMSPRGVFPIVVSARNSGPAIEGAVEVGSESYMESLDHQRYPLSLPGGTVKRLIVYPSLPSYTTQVTVSFHGSARLASATLKVEREAGSQNIGLIGDEIGGLVALRKQENENQGNTSLPGGYRSPARFSDCYARPEDAPDRAIGYQALRTLFLSNGAERMSAAQWTAIRQWVVGGGALVLLGGGQRSVSATPGGAAACSASKSRVRFLRLISN